MNILVKLKGNREFEYMKTSNVVKCLMCSFGCSFSVLERMLLKGLTLKDKFGNEYKMDSADSAPLLAKRRDSKNNVDDSQVRMEV